MIELPEWLSTFGGQLVAPAGAATLFGGCRAVGAWLDKEADEEWRNAAQAYLRNGTWLAGAAALTAATSSLFDKIYGPKYFSWLALKRCAILTFITSAILFIFIFFRHYVVMMNFFDNKIWIISVGYFFRLVIAIPFDFLSFLRVRMVIRHSDRSRFPFFLIFLSFIFDMIVIFLVYEFLEAVTTYYDSFVSMQLLSHTYRPYFAFHPDVPHFLSGLSLAYSDAAFLYAAIIPSILFYIYILGIVLGKLIGKLTPLVVWTSRHLKFSEPFKALFSLGGGILSGTWLAVTLLIKHV